MHNETTTGVTSDVHGVRQAMDAAGHPALLLVDGVSSIGALDFQFDKWRVDVAVTGSQKAMSLPTGLAYVCASKKVRVWRQRGWGGTVRYYSSAAVRRVAARRWSAELVWPPA